MDVFGLFANVALDSVDLAMKGLGPALVFLAIALISLVAYTFFTCVLPYSGWHPVFVVFLGCVGVFLLVNIVYNYWKTLRTDPGLPPEFETVEMGLEEGSLDPSLREGSGPKQCRKCGRLKPQRCHHCSVCKRCVLKMDHHCPWVNGCVGHHNYRYFCLFMFWLSMGCLFALSALSQMAVSAIFYPRESTVPYRARQWVALSFVICCSVFVALGALGGFHLYLTLTNQTTIEFQGNYWNKLVSRSSGVNYRNPYDLGRWRNLREVFGPSRFPIFLFPYIAQPPSGDGMSFHTLGRPL
eukprot:GDKI01034813.1.p1 GENE.GDKI01034813.1~~GDKI01034813.1.p1  ORF type:complete len:297 (+),score=49.57 GDKI01034813.1:143-1033(+)